jgi:hypothetical protein
MLTERFDRFFKADEDKIKEAEQIIGLLKDSPELKERIRQRDEKRLANIRRLIAQRDGISQLRAATMPGLEAARDEALEKEKRAHGALQVATQERVNAEGARLSASLDFSFRVSTVEGEIKKAAPREIDEFVLEMIKADEAARLEYNIEQRPGPKSRIIGHVTSALFNSNKQAVDAKREYLKSAIAKAESMKLQAIPHDQIIARLKELKAGIPKSYRFETIEIPLPDVRELQRGAS